MTCNDFVYDVQAENRFLAEILISRNCVWAIVQFVTVSYGDAWSNIWYQSYNRNNYFLSRCSIQCSGALRAYISAVAAAAYSKCILSVIIFLLEGHVSEICVNVRAYVRVRTYTIFQCSSCCTHQQNLPTIVKSHKRLFDYETLILRNCAMCCLRRIDALKLKCRIAKQNVPPLNTNWSKTNSYGKPIAAEFNSLEVRRDIILKW